MALPAVGKKFSANSTEASIATARPLIGLKADNTVVLYPLSVIIDAMPDASNTVDGFMSSAFWQKLDDLPADAEANAVDSVFGRSGAVVANAGDYDNLNQDFNGKNASNAVLVNYREKYLDKGSVSGGVSVDVAAAQYQKLTIAGATTLSFTNIGAAGEVKNVTLELINPSTNISWPAGTQWSGGTAPTLTTTGKDLVSFLFVNGVTAPLAFLGGLAMAAP